MINSEETLAILKARGMKIDPVWLRKKARDGKIPGAQKIGGERGIWLFPRQWAETYEKSVKGRRRKDEQ